MNAMSKKATIGAWLQSKQDDESLEMLQKYINYFVTIDSYLKLRVVQHVKDNYTKIGRVLYKTRDCYKDNITYKQFAKSVQDVASANVDLRLLIEKSIDIILAKDEKLKAFSRSDVKNVILCYIFFTTYVAYSFEQQVRDLIISSDRFKVGKLDVLDDRFAIDLVVLDKVTKKRIALQFKSFTFLNMSADKRNNYKNKNIQAINKKFVDDVYYVFHTHTCEIVTNNFVQLTHYKDACSCDDNIVLIEDDEYFIKELIMSFEHLEKAI